MKNKLLVFLMLFSISIVWLMYSTGFFRTIEKKFDGNILKKVSIDGVEDITINQKEGFAIISSTKRKNFPPPETPKEDKEVPCPGPAQLRVGDITQAGDERVTGHQLIPDPNNPKVNICETLYEPTTAIEKFLPSVNQTTTTVAIAVVATAGAAATPLLLRVFKPIITKLWKTIQQKLGKKEVKLSRNDIIANEYRAKRGLPPIKKSKV